MNHTDISLCLCVSMCVLCVCIYFCVCCRGGGVDQRLLQDLSRRVAAGEWCHVFPEGKCYQQHTLGGRE